MDVCENRQMGVTMISYKIKNVKHFMGKFLTTESFDSFLVEEASVSTYNTFLIDGRQNKAFYTGTVSFCCPAGCRIITNAASNTAGANIIRFCFFFLPLPFCSIRIHVFPIPLQPTVSVFSAMPSPGNRLASRR